MTAFSASAADLPSPAAAAKAAALAAPA